MQAQAFVEPYTWDRMPRDPYLHQLMGRVTDPMMRSFITAMMDGNLDQIDSMIKNILIDPNRSACGIDILTIAVHLGRPEVVSCILENGADITHSAVGMAIKMYRHWDQLTGPTYQVVKVLARAVGGLSAQKLVTAVFADKFQTDPQRFQSFFLFACSHYMDEIVLILLDYINDETRPLFVDIDWFKFHDNQNPLHYMARMNYETAERMLDALPFQNELIFSQERRNGRTPLHIAVIASNLELVITLVKGKPGRLALVYELSDLDVIDLDKRSALHHSVRRDPRIMKVLLQAGCATDLVDYYGCSVLKDVLRYFPTMEPQIILDQLELLLAYGVNLQLEPYLYTVEEMPEKFEGGDFAKLRDIRDLDSQLLHLLQDRRRGIEIDPLMQLCRNVIRRQLQPKADKKIEDFDFIPERMKSFLLVKELRQL